MKNKFEKILTIEGVLSRKIQSLCREVKSKSVSLLALGAMFAVFSATAPVLGADGEEEGNKRDIVFLVNGDRISGEINKLQDGVLYIKTELAGDVQVLWKNVDHLEGGTLLVFTLLDETVYRGSLGKESAESASLTVHTPEGSIQLNPSSLDVVGTTVKPPTNRFKGSVNFGLTLLKANETRQLSFGTKGSYAGDSYYSEAAYNTFHTSNSNSEANNRDSLRASYQRMLPHNWFFTGMFNAARNDALGLDIRYNIGGAVGKDIVGNDAVTLQAMAGVDYVSEKYEARDKDRGAEAVFGLKLKAFELDSPKLSLTGETLFYPKLGNFDRFRLEARTSLNLILAKNIFWGLSFFDSYSNQTPSPGKVKNDYGLVSSLGVSF